MNIEQEIDRRDSLFSPSETRSITLKNFINNLEEQFEIIGEQGRGGCCIVYRAIFCEKGVKIRPVLLKEFYPADFSEELCRDPKSLSLHFDGRRQDDFKIEKENFLETCLKQQEFYLHHVENADELVDVQGLYTLGDSLYMTTRAVGGCSWDKIPVEEENFYQILETTLSLLRELRILHENNMLHADIKPENVYIFKKTRQHVGILDFGSIQQLFDGCLTGNEKISYSGDFAAPEILNAKDKQDLDRRDYFSCITKKADLFSVGAVLYTRLTGATVPRDNSNRKLKEMRAAELSDFWRKEKFRRTKNLSIRVKKFLIKFFDGVLALNPDSRLEAEEMELQIRSLMILAAPQQVKLSSAFKPARETENFLGRTAELNQLKKFFMDNEQAIFIYGDGGLGKSQLALKFAQMFKEDWDFFLIPFDGDLKQTITNLQTVPMFLRDHTEPIDIENLYLWNLNCLRSYEGNAVLIIDNFDLNPEKIGAALHSETFGDLLRLKMKIIFTCRHRPINFPACLEVAALSESELLNLIRRHYRGADEKNLLPQVIRATNCNTLLIEQAAKILEQSWGELSPEKILLLLTNSKEKKSSAVAESLDRLKILFDISVLSATAKKIMAQAVLLPTAGVNAAMFLRCHDEIQADKIRLLELSGWLKKSTNNLLSLHPLVREVCKSEIPQAQVECKIFLESYHREFSKLSTTDRMHQRLQRVEIASNAAIFLEDLDGQLAQKAGELNMHEGRYRDAMFHYLHFWKILLAVHNNRPDTLKAMEVMDNLAHCESNVGNYNFALHYETSALAVAEEELGGECSQLFPYYLNLAGIYRRIGDFGNAKKFYAKALKFCDADDVGKVELYTNLAQFCLLQNENDDAERFADLAVKILNEQRECPPTMHAQLLEILSVISHRKKNFTDELHYAKRAANIYEEFRGKNHPITAESYNRVASALIALEIFDEAQRYLETAKKILEDIYGKNHGATGKTYFYMAQLFYKKKNLAEMMHWGDAATEIFAKVFGLQSRQTVEMMICLAVMKKNLAEIKF